MTFPKVLKFITLLDRSSSTEPYKNHFTKQGGKKKRREKAVEIFDNLRLARNPSQTRSILPSASLKISLNIATIIQVK